MRRRARAFDPGGVAVAAFRDVEIDAGIEDVEVEVSQEQEDIDQENEVDADKGLWNEETGYWSPAVASSEAYSGAVTVEQTGALFAGTVTLRPHHRLPDRRERRWY